MRACVIRPPHYFCRAFVQVLQGADAYDCGACGVKRTASKRNQVHRLPEVSA